MMHYDQVGELKDVLYRNGFVPCDIPACNCGSWHARYGLPERMEEIKSDLADAGHPLYNENGNLPRNALAALIGERDGMRDALRWAIRFIEIYAREESGPATPELNKARAALAKAER